jgi:hypothetical protein
MTLVQSGTLFTPTIDHYFSRTTDCLYSFYHVCERDNDYKEGIALAIPDNSSTSGLANPRFCRA